MAFPTPLIYNISTKQLVLSVAQPSSVGALSWFFEDTQHLLIQFVQNGSATGTVTVVPAAGIGLVIAAGKPGGTVYSEATAPAADLTNTFTVDLPMNTTQVQAALGSAPNVSCTLELRTNDGTNFQRYQIPLTIINSVISSALTSTPPPDVAIGAAAANTTFVKRNGAAGDFQILTSADGSKQVRFYLGNDGTTHFDVI